MLAGGRALLELRTGVDFADITFLAARVLHVNVTGANVDGAAASTNPNHVDYSITC